VPDREVDPFFREIIGSRDTFGVEIDPEPFRGSTGEETRYRLVVWSRSGGSGFGVTIETIEKARAVAEYLYEVLKPEHERDEREQDERTNRMHEQMSAESAKRRIEEKRARRKRLAKITSETPTVEKIKCPECEHIDDPDAFDEPAYECGGCSSTGRGEDGRRCDQCHRFRARVGLCSCPECEAPIEDNTVPETVVGYEIDGEFIPTEEVKV
jgi:hypothetical protein